LKTESKQKNKEKLSDLKTILNQFEEDELGSKGFGLVG
jgi:hypothetical protein